MSAAPGTSTPDPTTAETPEIRDAGELKEDRVRTAVAGTPFGLDGRPMCQISATVSDKVPTVQFGNVVVGPVTMTRFIEDGGDSEEARAARIDQARLLQRDTEFVCGIERRLVQWALDASSKVASPITAEDAFAAPPVGYNGSGVVDPRDVAPAQVIPPPPSAQPNPPLSGGVQLG